MKFEDGSTRKNIKSVYTKLKIGLVEDEIQNKPIKNQNDALKLISSHFQDYCKKNNLNKENGQCCPKFKFFKDITEKILKNKDFANFLNFFR